MTKLHDWYKGEDPYGLRIYLWTGVGLVAFWAAYLVWLTH